MTDGAVPVRPHRPCAERWLRSTCSGFIASGEPQRRGWNPLKYLLIIWAFPWKSTKLNLLFIPK